MEPLDSSSAVPLYHQLFTRLREHISRGKIKPGELLPSEARLERAYDVSRITVRRAIDELARRGFVSREKGRGTRVLPVGDPTLPILGSVEGMLENNLVMGLKTDVEVVEFGYVAASEEIAAAIGVHAGEKVQRAVRVRRFREVPFSHLTTHVPEPIGRHYDAKDLARQPLLVLLERSRVVIERAEQVISAQSAPRGVARLLGVPPGSALLRLDRTVYATPNRPVEYLVALYQPELYRYRMTLRRQPDAGAR